MGLTDLQIKKLPPNVKRYEVLDGKGLYIRVMPSDAKSWFYRYIFDGIPRRMMLGSYPGISLAEARKRHAEAMIKVQQGIDPGKEAKEEKSKRKAAPTFQDLLDELWEVELCNMKSGIQTRKLLEKNAVSAWGKRKATDIKRRDIVILLDHIRARAPIVGNRVQGALSRLFNFAAERGIIDDSPCTRIKKIPEKGRSRVLTDDEIKLLWGALDLENKAVDIYRVSKLALKLILLTAQRPGEVAGMTWAEIDGDFWNVPAERMKNGAPNRVPLNPMALAVIEQARIYSGDCDYVFRSPYRREKEAKRLGSVAAISRHALSRAISRHWSEIGFQEAFTPHDLRRTLRTRLAELGVSDIIAERVLGHKLQGVLGIYNRHSYDTEKRQALALWEKRLCEILGLTESISNVIPFEVRHA